jgi:tetratricopeptide (TPR) repeat protein
VEAFEIAPDNADVVAAIDRVGKEMGRIGELADKVKKKFLPGSPDDRRVIFLGHLVYWYERVLSRGSEVSSFVSEIERHDKVHPVVLKRAAQLAAMNGDTKTQREYLQRALERTTRREEKVGLQLALASAYAGTPDALKHYELTLQLDPASIIALQGVKRLGKEKEQYAQVQWALERQAEVALTESEKVDALLELAELQETKFLKREAAADLLERVLELEPAQPQAMKGLERCYHALRDWPKLARILGIRAEHTFDKKAKVELLELAAEVHESKLGDAPGAVEVYRNLLVVEPKHRRALIDLARLYEKLGDWANVATYKARLAELAPTKRASSQELVKLGDFLNAPERDPIAAKLQYERAVSVDPTNAAGWEALQKLAAEAGDDRRVIECLEQRKKHTDVPRQRAAVLVELAKVHQAAGDDDAAQKAFEAAIRADSSNEIAAVAMLDAYTAEERWAEAAPLCELLVNAAIRDRDGESLFVRLRLATRIAAALGDAERAMTSAIAALDARPKDSGAQADLIAVASQCRASAPSSLERAREHLTRIAENADDLPGDHLVRLATLQRDFGDLDAAGATFERARRLEPEDQEIIRELADVYLAQGDFPRACKLKVDMARNATSADTRFDLFCEAGEIWARRAEELEKAASVFEEARAIRPMDSWLLQTMMWLYGELGEWGLLTGVLEDMAQVHEHPEEKLKSLLAMAEVVRDKLDDRVRAADLYDQVLDIDKRRLDIFEELVRTLTEEKNWERLERSYRKMIARVKDDDEPQLQFLLFHQLGLIYRDRLGDASRAYDALDAASRLRPDNAEVRKIVIELLVVTDNLDNAVARLRDEISRDPHEPQLYAELYELFLRQLFFDKAWCAVNVLSRLRDPTPEQRRFHEDYAPMPLDRVPGQIVEQAWPSHICHPDLDPSLSNIFAVLTPVVARMRYAQLRPEQRVGRPFTQQHSRMHDAIRGTFNNASEILAVAPPELLLGDLMSVAPFSPALAPFGSILVCGPAVEAQSMSLIFLVGKRLAEQRPELAARSFFPSVPDLSQLLATAVRVSRNEMAKDAAGAAQDQAFAATLSPQEGAALRSVVLQATSESAAFDVKRWLQAADLSSMRAGLLIAGDVEPARQAIMVEPVGSADLTPREKVGELYKFATSDLYSDLRGAIGVAVQS